MAQAFAIVEQLDRGLCVEEAGRLPTVMIGSTNPLRDPPSGRPSQPPGCGGEGRGRGGIVGVPQPMAAMSTIEDDPQTPAVQCWGCQEEGHTKRECPNKPRLVNHQSLEVVRLQVEEVEVARARINQPHRLPYHVQA